MRQGALVSKWRLQEARFHAENRFTVEQERGAGIYAIVNLVNGHVYIGQSREMTKRKSQHFKDLKSGSHANAYLQNAFNHYGSSSFRFLVLEVVDKFDDLNDREQYWIERTDSVYNIVRNVFDGFRFYRADKDNPPDSRYVKDGEKFDRPSWHKWVYGGERNPNA